MGADMFETELDRRVFRIKINRGGHRNAIPVSEWLNLEKAVRLANQSDAKIVVLQSSDPADFSAGSDLHDLHGLRPDEQLRKKFRGGLESVCSRLRNVNMPTICLIDGGCFGTAVALATSCDLRIASNRSMFAITPARFGISYPKGPLDDLVSLVGRGQAARMVYASDFIDAGEAHRIGLVEVLADEEGAEDFIQRMAANSQTSLSCLKASLLGRFGSERRFDAAFSHNDFGRGISAFRSRSSPDFDCA